MNQIFMLSVPFVCCTFMMLIGLNLWLDEQRYFICSDSFCNILSKWRLSVIGLVVVVRMAYGIFFDDSFLSSSFLYILNTAFVFVFLTLVLSSAYEWKRAGKYKKLQLRRHFYLVLWNLVLFGLGHLH